MKKLLLYLSIFLIPIFCVIITNEIVRMTIDQDGYNQEGVIAINSAVKDKDNCTWICHNNTNFCKENHVKIFQSYFKKIDPIYFGIINALKSTQKYALANILFLVILLPLMMYYLLIKSINYQLEIRKIKRR